MVPASIEYVCAENRLAKLPSALEGYLCISAKRRAVIPLVRSGKTRS